MLHPNADAKWFEQFGLNNRTGDIGVELEVEGDNLPHGDIESWVIKHENSLRGKNGRQAQPGDTDMPYEYVLGRPSTFKNLERKLRRLEELLTGPGVEVRLGERGSTHIHINMLNHTIKDIIGFLIIFTCIEPLLLRLCGPTRNGNLFCLPSYEAGQWTDTIQRMTASVLSSRVRHNWPTRRGKYAALNTDTLTTLGTLEIRCFPNSITASEINKWAGWLMHIRAMASDWKDETFLSFIDRAYKDPRWLIRQIFENEPLLGACHPDQPEALIQFGIEAAYEIAKAAQPMLAWDGKTQGKPMAAAFEDLDDLRWRLQQPHDDPPEFFDDDEGPR